MMWFCNYVLRSKYSSSPCNKSYPSQRYFQLNLVSLVRHGTLEFRAHSATYSGERVARWVPFVTAFTDRFGTVAGNPMAKFFDDDVHTALHQLRIAQDRATIDDLFEE